MSPDHAHDARRAVYVISVAAELAGVHPQTLRIYERKGLVDPARTAGGSRRYSDADIAHLRRIQELTAEGLNLAGVERVMALEVQVRALRAELVRAQAEVHQAHAQVVAEVEAAHREHRRDLVPVHQSLVLWRGGRSNR